MNLRLIRWRLPLSYAVIALLAALSLGAVLILTLRGYYLRQERDDMQANAQAMSNELAPMLETDFPDFVIRGQLMDFSFLVQSRIRLLDNQGNVIVDTGTPTQHVVSYSDPSDGGVLAFTSPIESQFYPNESGSPASPPILEGPSAIEISGEPPYPPPEAIEIPLTGETDVITRQALPVAVYRSLYGLTLAEDTVEPLKRSSTSVSQPILGIQGERLGMLELSEGPAYGAEIVASVARAWAISGIVATLLAAGMGWVVSQRLVMPLLALTDITEQMAAGDLSARARADMPDEFGALGRSFNEMARRVEAMVASLRNFVADAAHELNTPLTALRTNLELAAEQRTTSGSNHLEQAQGQLARLEALVDGLLALSHLETASETKVTVDLKSLVGELSEVYASRAEQEEISFSLEVPEAEVSLLGDPVQLRCMVENLLNNAIKFTPTGGSVRLELSLDGGQVCLRVQDTGIGIPVEDQARLFQRFHRGRNAAAYPGSGLGLTIVKAIVEGHYGEVGVESTAQGTCVTVTLPGKP